MHLEVLSSLTILLSGFSPQPLAQAASGIESMLKSGLQASHPGWNQQPLDPISRVLAKSASTIERGIVVQAISGEAGQPIPGACVIISNEGSLQARTETILNIPPAGGLLGRRLKNSQWFKCDRTGRTRIPFAWAHQTSAFILVRHKQLIGIGVPKQIRAGSLRITLQPSHALKVRVQDELGASVAGIQVALQVGDSWTRSGSGTNLVSVSTDTEGLATIRNAHAIWTLFAKQPSASPAIGIVAGLGPAVLKAITLPGTAPSVVELTVPKLLSTTVRVRTKNGKAPPAGTMVSISSGRKGLPTRLWKSAEAVLCTAAGDAPIRYFGRGRRWQVMASHPDFPVVCTVARAFMQPTGLPESIDLIWEPQCAVYTGVMLDDGDEVISGAKVSLTFPKAGGTKVDLQLNEQGGFQLRRPLLKDGSELVVISHQSHEALLQNIIELPQKAPGTWDLGPIHLAKSRRVASGIILGKDGKELEGAKLFAQMPPAVNAGVITNWVLAPLWTLSNADGHFELYLPAQGLPPEIAIVAKYPTANENRSQFISPGATDIRMTMQEYGSLHIKVALPEGFTDLTQIGVELVPGYPPLKSHLGWWQGPRKQRQGNILHLEWRQLPVAAYDLRVFLPTSKDIWPHESKPSTIKQLPRNSRTKMSLRYDARRGEVTLSNVRVHSRAQRLAPLPMLHLDLIMRTVRITVESTHGHAIPSYLMSINWGNDNRTVYFGGETNSKVYLIPRHAKEARATAHHPSFHSNSCNLTQALHTLTVRPVIRPCLTVEKLPTKTSAVLLSLHQNGRQVYDIPLGRFPHRSSWYAFLYDLWEGEFEVLVTVTVAGVGGVSKEMSRSFGSVRFSGEYNQSLELKWQ